MGAVILNIDYQLTENAFVRMGISNFRELFSKMRQNQLFDLLETGKINRLDFYNQLREISATTLSNSEIETAWNAMLLNLPAERLVLLNQLKQQYRLFLLSNTNEIHIDSFTRYLNMTYGPQTLERIFEKCYYSNLVKMRKPDREIFELVLQENQLLPEETLFIDDSIQHVHGALTVGIQAFHLAEGMDITGLFGNAQ